MGNAYMAYPSIPPKMEGPRNWSKDLEVGVKEQNIEEVGKLR